jgi:hypothetical protein
MCGDDAGKPFVCAHTRTFTTPYYNALTSDYAGRVTVYDAP